MPDALPDALPDAVPDAATLRALRWILCEARLDGPTLAARVGFDLPALQLEAHERAEFAAWDAAAPAGVAPADAPIDDRWRLGLHVERLVALWVCASRHAELLASNWLLRRDARTVGEADLLVRRGHGTAAATAAAEADGDGDGSTRFEHWEVAFKIYLAIAPGHDLGLDLRDTLAGKCRHLRDRQLALTCDPGFAAAWRASVGARAPGAALAPAAGWHARTILSGWLFAPLARVCDGSREAPDRRRPPATTVTKPPHGWLVADMAGLDAAEALGRSLGVGGWTVLGRREWLMPVQLDPGADVARAERGVFGTLAGLAVAHPMRPAMIAGLGAAPGGGMTELLRLVAVSQRWADAASSGSSPISASAS
ncbi:MAG: DUF1853 family protein [Lautropia sp.]